MSQSENSRRYYLKHKEKRKAYTREYYAKNKKMVNTKKKIWYDENAKTESFRDHYSNIQRSARLRKKCLVLDKYGGECKCCGENRIEFLAIDHIEGGGTEHRKQLTTKIYNWLKTNKFTSGFQVLCHNCNMAKVFCEVCPHKRDKDGEH